VGVFSYLSPEQRIPHDHPLRQLRVMAPEKLLRALLLQVLYSVRRERILMEQLDYSLRAVSQVGGSAPRGGLAGEIVKIGKTGLGAHQALKMKSETPGFRKRIS
jgi:hypothetical protein